MFAPPLGPPPAPSLSSNPLPVPGGMHTPFPGSESTSPFQQSQELIRRELDRQFLDRLHQDRLPTPSSSLPSYIHQHQHQHMHQHQHTHFGPTYPPGLPGSLVPPNASHLFEKSVPKFESPFYRPSVPSLPGYPGLSPFIHSGPGPTPCLGSGIHGAFQPKNLSSNMHHSQLLINHVTQREREKSTASGPGTPAPPNKKSGKWCAMHVRVAWEIYHHQQKQQADAQKTPDGKGGADPLRPPSHMLPGSGLHRSPADLSATPTLFGPRTSGVPPFPRPSPYGGLGTGLGSFGGLGGSLLGGRDLPGMPVMTSPHEWNRLHRTPPSFPTPPAWPKSDLEREKEKDRERDREREQREKEREDREKREIDREKDREKERELEKERDKPPELERGPSLISSSHSSPARDYRTNGVIDSDSDKHTTVRHRSRSRSPVRNGPTEDHQRDSSSRDSAFKNDVRIKEERKEDHSLPILQSEIKDKRNDILRSDLRSDLMNSHSVAALMPPANALQLLESRRMLSLAGYPGMLDRPPNPALWNPLDRGLDLTHHRLELQREMERERDRMLQRFPPTLGAMMEHENRIREHQEIQLRERANIEARLAQMDRERAIAIEMDRAKLPLFRHGELPPPAGLYSSHTRGMSPAVNHNHTNSNSKSSSPSTNTSGIPPPLIPSSATLTPHSHSNSPSLTKGRSSSPAPEAAPPEPAVNGSDTDAQSR